MRCYGKIGKAIGMTMLGALLLISCASAPEATSGRTADGVMPAGAGILPESSGWKLIWSDEFDGFGWPDPNKWTFDEFRPFTFNSELQGYLTRQKNGRIEGGRLILEARHDPDQNEEGYKYSSARINSDRKFAFTYGRVEFRAKLPRGLGTWPALWLMPANSMGHGKTWPDSGEIDVMEAVGHEVGKSFSTVHTAAFNWVLGTQRQGILEVPGMYDEWHVYALEWYPDHLTCFVDDKPALTVKKNDGDDWKAWPFDLPFYIIMNVAVGGSWGGQKGVDDDAFPARIEVDYVRVYQNPAVAGNTATH